MIYHLILNKGLETAVLCLLESIPIWACPALYIAVNYSVRIALKKIKILCQFPSIWQKKCVLLPRASGHRISQDGWGYRLPSTTCYSSGVSPKALVQDFIQSDLESLWGQSLQNLSEQPTPLLDQGKSVSLLVRKILGTSGRFTITALSWLRSL